MEFAFFFIILISICNGLVATRSDGQILTILASKQRHSSENQVVTAPIIVTEDDGCVSLPSNANGKIVMILPKLGCFPAYKLRSCLAVNCSGLILSSNWTEGGLDGMSRFETTDLDIYDQTANHNLIVWLGSGDSKSLRDFVSEAVSNNYSLSVTIRSDDENTFSDILNGPIGIVLFSVVIGALCLSGLILGSTKLIQFKLYRGKIPFLSAVIIGWHLLTLLVRFAYCVIDPCWSRGIMGLLPGRILIVWTLSWGFAISCIVAQYWLNSLIKAKIISLSASRKKLMRIVQWLVGLECALCILLELSASVALGLNYEPTAFITMSGVLLGISQLIVGILYVTVGYKLVKHLKGVKDIREHARQKNTRITTLLAFSGAFQILEVITLGVPSTNEEMILGDHRGFVCVIFLLYLWSTSTSLIQLLIFTPQRSDNKKSTSAQTHTQTNSAIVQKASNENMLAKSADTKPSNETVEIALNVSPSTSKENMKENVPKTEEEKDVIIEKEKEKEKEEEKQNEEKQPSLNIQESQVEIKTEIQQEDETKIENKENSENSEKEDV